MLTPYKSSDGNNPYTTAQLEQLYKDLEPQAKAPGKYTLEEKIKLQRAFLEHIANGFTATRAVQKLQALSLKEPEKWPYAEYGTFMAWKYHDKNFSDAYEAAYAMGTDQLEDKAVEMAYGGNATMLQFLLKMRNPDRYVPKQEHTGPNGGALEHVHTVRIVGAPARAEKIEGRGGRECGKADSTEIIDAEVIYDR